MLVDSHCHLDFPTLAPELDASPETTHEVEPPAVEEAPAAEDAPAADESPAKRRRARRGLRITIVQRLWAMIALGVIALAVVGSVGAVKVATVVKLTAANKTTAQVNSKINAG